MTVYWDSFAQLQDELDRMLSTAFGTRGPVGGVFPPVNLFDRGEELLVKAELPGVDPAKIDVNVEGDMLTLRGERRLTAPGEDGAFHRHERSEGRFRRVVRLPARVATSDIRAEYHEGVLTVHVPKAKEQKPRRVEIQVG